MLENLTPAAKGLYLARVVMLAKEKIGEREIGFTNTGPFVDKVLASVGLDPGNPWCAAFVYWCFATIGYLAVNGAELLVKTGLVEAQVDHAREMGTLVSADDALKDGLEPGWIMCQWHPAEGRYAHCGIVSLVSGSIFHSVEGNTTLDPWQRDGNVVAEQLRHVGDTVDGRNRYAFIRTR